MPSGSARESRARGQHTRIGDRVAEGRGELEGQRGNLPPGARLAASAPAKREATVRHGLDARAEPCAFAVECLLEPAGLVPGSLVQAEASDPKRCHLEAHELAASRVEGCKVQEHELGAVLRLASDAFVVVQEIAAAVEDGPAAVDLDALRVMARVAVYHVYTGLVDGRIASDDKTSG